MIEHLTGTVIEKTPTSAVLSAGGVGYGVLIPLATFEKLPAVGEQASLYTWLAVREDALTLYGFATREEREVFLLLTSVTGVGPKIGLGMLSGGGVDQVRTAIARGDIGLLVKVPGVGRKLAERLVLELRDKIQSAGTMGSISADASGPAVAVREETLAALLALGYNRQGAERAIRGALKENPDAEKNVESLIKASLRALT